MKKRFYTYIIILISLCSCTRHTNDKVVFTSSLVSEFDSINSQKIRINLPKQERRLIRMNLKNVKDYIPEVIVNLKYSTKDNFFGFDAYGDLVDAYLQLECIEKLQEAYKILQLELPDYTFIIYDAARPLSVQQIMWDSIKVPEHQKFWYVADPDRGSIHNYGMAVDLTIADKDGNPLDMGTDYDYFGELAFPRFTQKFLENGELTQEQANNRLLLIDIMERAGFTVARTEWWHFNASSLAYAKGKYKIIE